MLLRLSPAAAVAAVLLFCSASNSLAQLASPTIRLEVDGQLFEGTPLSWTKSDVLMLARDGTLKQFPTSSAQNFSKVADVFRGLTQGEMRGLLQREFGNSYQVSGTGHYLVVHPSGQRDQWAPRFESLYRSFMHYFNVRGLQPTEPAFPLVAVVFPARQQFDQYVRNSGGNAGPNVLGYYSPTSNRILLYDITGGQGNQANWHHNADTIIHEATHQTAFNTGVHNRFSMPPRWVGEGLGTMFEAAGVWNSREYPDRGHRLNQGQLQTFRQYLPRRRQGALAELVSSDRLFETNSQAAYAEAWALSFFLAETRPTHYSEYLRRTASRPTFSEPNAVDRMSEFTDVFGSNLKVLEAHYLRFIETL